MICAVTVTRIGLQIINKRCRGWARGEDMISKKEYFDYIYQMKSRGCILYGGGMEGRKAIEILNKAGISIHKIGDRIRKEVDGYLTAPLAELCEQGNNEVCIMTVDADEERESLSKYYSLILNMEIVYTINEFYPDVSESLDYHWAHPFNHYESPYLSEMEIENYHIPREILGINLDYNRQKKICWIYWDI